MLPKSLFHNMYRFYYQLPNIPVCFCVISRKNLMLLYIHVDRVVVYRVNICGLVFRLGHIISDVPRLVRV